MAFYAANVEQVWAEEARSLRNRTIVDVPRISETDPCADARVEIRRLRKENAQLQQIVNDATAKLLVQQTTTPGLATNTLMAEQAANVANVATANTLMDHLSFQERRDKIESFLPALNDTVHVYTGQHDMVVVNCNTTLFTPSTGSRNGQAATGGVLMLIGAKGLHMQATGANTTKPMVFDPESRIANQGVKQSIADLRALVRNWLGMYLGTKVFVAADGMLQVPCIEHIEGPMILYGKLGITFQGSAVGTVGQV